MNFLLRNYCLVSYPGSLITLVFCLIVVPVKAQTEVHILPPPPNILEHQEQLLEPQGSLSLTKALSLALLHNPSLQDVAWDSRLGDIKILQASLLANPELEIETENFLGSGELRDFDQIETTLSVSQLFELGGKRSKRQALAETERDLAIWDYEAERIAIIAQVTSRYIDVVSNQEKLKLANKIMILAEDILRTVVSRVKAGKVSPLEQSKASVELARARLNKAKLAREVIANKQNLAALWGSTKPLFSQATGDLLALPTIPELTSLLARLQNNPDLARWSAEIAHYQKAITLAKAKKIPNLTFTVGARHSSENDDVAMVAGISTPLFIFDNKQTGVDEANSILTQALQKRQVAHIALHSALIDHYQQLKISQIAVKVLGEQVLPSAKTAYAAAETAYRLGKIDSIDLLDAQNTLFQSNEEYLQVLTQLHLQVANIERLIGGALNPATAKHTE